MFQNESSVVLPPEGFGAGGTRQFQHVTVGGSDDRNVFEKSRGDVTGDKVPGGRIQQVAAFVAGLGENHRANDGQAYDRQRNNGRPPRKLTIAVHVQIILLTAVGGINPQTSSPR